MNIKFNSFKWPHRIIWSHPTWSIGIGIWISKHPQFIHRDLLSFRGCQMCFSHDLTYILPFNLLSLLNQTAMKMMCPVHSAKLLCCEEYQFNGWHQPIKRDIKRTERANERASISHHAYTNINWWATWKCNDIIKNDMSGIAWHRLAWHGMAQWYTGFVSNVSNVRARHDLNDSKAIKLWDCIGMVCAKCSFTAVALLLAPFNLATYGHDAPF